MRTKSHGRKQKQHEKQSAKQQQHVPIWPHTERKSRRNITENGGYHRKL